MQVNIISYLSLKISGTPVYICIPITASIALEGSDHQTVTGHGPLSSPRSMSNLSQLVADFENITGKPIQKNDSLWQPFKSCYGA